MNSDSLVEQPVKYRTVTDNYQRGKIKYNQI